MPFTDAAFLDLRAAHMQANNKNVTFQNDFDTFLRTLCTSTKTKDSERLGLLYAGAFHGIHVPDEVTIAFDRARIDLIEGVTGKKRKGSVEGSPTKKRNIGNETAGGRGKKRKQRDEALVDASVQRVKVCPQGVPLWFFQRCRSQVRTAVWNSRAHIAPR